LQLADPFLLLLLLLLLLPPLLLLLHMANAGEFRCATHCLFGLSRQRGDLLEHLGRHLLQLLLCIPAAAAAAAATQAEAVNGHDQRGAQLLPES
jgi:hypothetical protein